MVELNSSLQHIIVTYVSNFTLNHLDVPVQPPRMPPAAPPNQNEELYEVVTTGEFC